MSYEVLRYFEDLQDGRHPYNTGDVFPRDGLEVSKERIAELAGSNNKLGQPLIKAPKAEKSEAPAKNADVAPVQPKKSTKGKK